MKYLALLFLSLICVAAEPRFHYQDCVKITRGFYKDCHGRVDEYLDYDNTYYVQMDTCRGIIPIGLDFKDKDLEPSKECP